MEELPCLPTSPFRGKAAIMCVSSGSHTTSSVRQPHPNCVATHKRWPYGVYRAFRPFPRVAGPLWGPSSNHPLCGWYMIVHPPCRWNVPPIAHGYLLCYPGPEALMTTCAPSANGERRPSASTPERPWGHDHGCLVREPSPSGSTQTRACTEPGGRVRPPPDPGVLRETVSPSPNSRKGAL
jgi:hypothetical protein